MTKPITLKSPRYRVVLGDVDDPASWQEVEVQALTRDIQMAEGLFAKHKWGKPTDQPIKITAVSAYFALRRSGAIEPTTSWDAFEQSYLEVTEAGVDEVDPTQPELEAG